MNDKIIDLETRRRSRRGPSLPTHAAKNGPEAADVVDLHNYQDPIEAEAALCSAIVDEIERWKPLTRSHWT